MKIASRILALCLAVCFASIGALVFPSSAQAAEFTDLLDAADDMDDYDDDTYDPFDFSLEPSFTYETGTADITREAPCVPSGHTSSDNDPAGNNPRVQRDNRCDEVGIVDNKEMLYRHQEARMDIDLRAGMYKDLELRINVPIVFSSTHGMKYANEGDNAEENVDETNSGVDPSETGDRSIKSNSDQVFGQDKTSSKDEALGQLNQYKMHSFFDLSGEYQEYDRAGLADPSIGVGWAPFNDQRDDTKATLALGMDYTLPIAEIRQHDNDAVGEGLHKLNWSFRSSKKFDMIDPYFGLGYTLQLPARGSPIKELKDIDPDNGGQSVTQPPQKGKITIGTEFIPHEDKEAGERYGVDLRFNFGYNSEGRDYTPLYEHMVNSKCNGRTRDEVLPEYSGGSYEGPGGVDCSWIAQRPANVTNRDPVYDVGNLEPDDEFQTNGIMTVEGHAVFSGHIGFYLQPTEYFQFKAIAGLTHRQEHFLTNARTGEDVPDSQEETNDSSVDLTGEDAELERNPAYNSTYDSPGTRFRVNEFNSWNFLFTAALQF